MKKSLGYFLVILAAVSWGFIGVFNRMLAATGISIWNRMCIRNTGAFLICLVIFGIFRPAVFRIRLRHLPMFICSGVLGIVGSTVFYMASQMTCSLAVSAILLYLAPVLVMLSTAILWKQPLTPRRIIAVLMALLGCAFVSGIVVGGLTASVPGLLFAIASGFAYAGYTIFSHYNLLRYDAYTCFFWSVAMAGIASMVGFNGHAIATVFSTPAGLVGALGLSAVCTVLPFLCYTVGLTAIESGIASVITNIEPVTATVVGIVIYHENLTLWTGLGVVLVLGAAILLTLGENKDAKQKESCLS